MAPNLPIVAADGRRRAWAPIFMPKLFVQDHEEITTESFNLSQKKLKALGKDVSEIRNKFRKQVEYGDSEEDKDGEDVEEEI